MASKFKFLLPLFCVVMLLVPALPVPEFWITQLNYIGLYSIVSLGLVLLTGVAGLTSFGQAAFVGVGAYTSAYMSTALGISPWLALFVGLVLANQTNTDLQAAWQLRMDKKTKRDADRHTNNPKLK